MKFASGPLFVLLFVVLVVLQPLTARATGLEILAAAASAVQLEPSSFLFGDDAIAAFGRAGDSKSQRYFAQARVVLSHQFAPLVYNFGSAQPSQLRILIKDDSIASPVTQLYVDTLSREKSYLMRIYGLSNSDYNRLAAIAFGILGRETKFGTSFKYKLKESSQPAIASLKAMRQGLNNFINGTDRKPSPNSRGLTQMKDVPDRIEHFYCASEDKLNDPQVTAVATLGFLAESLQTLKNRVHNKQLSYVNDRNLFDYVLYVYFGSMRQLENPFIDYNTGKQIREVATPALNIYVQTVHNYMKALALFERPGLTRHSDSACRIPGDN